MWRSIIFIGAITCICTSFNSIHSNHYYHLPKVELHLHLDCSLSYEVVKRLTPSITRKEYFERFVAPVKCRNLADYISRAASGIELMQTKEQLRLVTLDLFKQLKSENVVYAELRFAPLLHLTKGLTPEDVVKTVNAAVSEGEYQYGIEAGIILCTLRHFSRQQSLETAALAYKFKGTNVVGLDIAADEAGYPLEAHIEAFEYARKKGVNRTAHAGEAKGAVSVWETLRKLQPQRIGHGIRSNEDSVLIAELIQKNIHLEICPSSNVQTNVFEGIRDHVIDKMFKQFVSLSVSTDTRAITSTTLSEEYLLLEQTFGWSKRELKQCNLQAIKHAFTSEHVKNRIKGLIEASY